MITFIIPLIHPQHKKVDNYSYLYTYLKRTLVSLLSIKEPSSVIVVCHGNLPTTLKKLFEKKVTFLVINNVKIFDILKSLDDKSSNLKEFYNSPKIMKYLKMYGKFHNKDKGLKYFIGLLYLYYLPEKQKPHFVGLVDGDDFIHENIGYYLKKNSEKFNQFFINKGYLLHSKNYNSNLSIDSIYKINKYSSICGSNRFFKYSFLEKKLKTRLNFDFSDGNLTQLIVNQIVTENLTNEILTKISQRPQSWSILPSFFGIHRLYLKNKKITHNFHQQFHIKFLSKHLGMKFMYGNNHSSSKNFDINQIINRYQKKNIVPKKNQLIINYKPIIKKFNL